MYYIYHIKGIKIGCSINPKKRIQQQGYRNSDWEILEEHLDKTIASNREIELQKQYGYKVDFVKYTKTIKIGTYEGRSKGGKKNVQSGKLIKAGEIGREVMKNTVTKDFYSNIGKMGSDKANYKNEYEIYAYKYPSMEFIGEYITQHHAARDLCLAHSSINNILNKKRGMKQTGGYTFKYKNKLVC